MADTSVIKEVTDADDEHYDILTEDSKGFYFEKKYGVIPKVGDKITIYSVRGSTIRGIDINDSVVFFKTDKQLDDEHKAWCDNYHKQQEEAFQKNQAKLDADYDSLPAIFKRRIDKFRKANPKFRVEFEGYELFCCKEAMKIAKVCKTKDDFDNFHKLEYAAQKEFAGIGDGHSGNTFGASVRLAYWYVTNPENVENEHGALSTLVGCEEYGCHKKESVVQK